MLEECIKTQKNRFIYGLGQIVYSDKVSFEDVRNIKNMKLNKLANENYSFIQTIRTDILNLAKSTEIMEREIKSLFIKWSTNYIYSIYNIFTESSYEKLEECTNNYLTSESLDGVIDCFINLINDRNILVNSKRGYNKEIDFVINYIDKHYSEQISVQKIAIIINYSPNYLSAIFKKICGVNITQYINSVRLENAKILLKTTKLHQYEIAQKVGFTNESYFSYLFKKNMDVTANDFRKI